MRVLQTQVDNAELVVPGEHRVKRATNGCVHVEATQPTELAGHAQRDVLRMTLVEGRARDMRCAGPLAVRLATCTRPIAATSLLVLVKLRELKLELNVAFSRAPHLGIVVPKHDLINRFGVYYSFRRSSSTSTFRTTSSTFGARTSAPNDRRHRDAVISDRLAHVVMQMIESDPAKRPSSIGTAVLMLAEAGSADGVHPHGVAVLREVAVDLIPLAELGATMRSISSPIASASASKADSRYRVIEKLGADGMAEVFLAEALGGRNQDSCRVKFQAASEVVLSAA